MNIVPTINFGGSCRRVFYEERTFKNSSAGTDGICQRCDGGDIYLKPDYSRNGAVRANGQSRVPPCGEWFWEWHPVPTAA